MRTSEGTIDDARCPSVAPLRAIPHGFGGSNVTRGVGIGWPAGMSRRGTVNGERSAGRRVVPRVALTPAEAAEAIGCSAEFFREHVDLELRWIRRGRKD